jgi:hypothetical protein
VQPNDEQTSILHSMSPALSAPRRPDDGTEARKEGEHVTVKSTDLINGKAPARARPRIGFLRPGHVERAFVALLYLALLFLVLLSIVGTFYGWRGEQAPLTSPRQIVDDVFAGGPRLWWAVALQAALTLAQYGARQFARADRRWWLLYLAALAISVYYNFQAYWTPLNELTAWYTAAVLIVAGDVLPEFLAVRHE